MTRNTPALLAAALALTLAAPDADAQVVISTADGDGADALLLNDAQDAGTGPGVNRGGIAITTLRVSAGSRIRVPIFRFDVEDVAGDLSGSSLAFDITFNNGNRSRDVQLYGVVDGPLDTFGEGTVTYANAPGIDYTDPNPATPELEPTSQLSLDLSELTFLGSFQVSGSGTQTTLTPSVVAGAQPVDLTSFLNNDTNGLVTFLLTRGSDANVVYDIATKENTTAGVSAPRLVLPNAVVPEPTTLALAGLGGLALLRRRRA